MTGPVATLTTGDNQGPLSFLPGQRYSACTCPGEDHPGPSNNVGRAAPEIDLIEAQIIIDLAVGEVSQSNQIAPYDAFYQYNNASIYCDIADLGISKFNSYKGGIYQEAVSVLTQVPSRIYRDQVVGGRRGEFASFELEWYADFKNRKNGHITWAVDGKRAWTMYPGAIAANPLTEIGDRIIAEEPMYMIFNYHMVSLDVLRDERVADDKSNNFQAVNFAQLTWPNEYRVDYIRVYQRGDGTIGCDPSGERFGLVS
jgi:beta-glucanase (GH16 family)